ncbi:hypothetical protein [Microvirga massiliensis]|jgi:hypothetical protein|uniref:hypothetical protein n=1 Tax=Microvirga massiliensis TaxID=1033741 RepID=UPI00062BED71|nr:hypothetical protein [Microvirga massiliensis]
MDIFATSVGQMFCNAAIGLTGAGIGRCYNAADMRSLGFGLIALIAMTFVSTRLMARRSR